MGKKIIPVLLSLALCLSLLPAGVLATGDEVVPVVRVGTVDALTTPKGEGWSYDAETATLTLEGAEVTEAEPHIHRDDRICAAGIFANTDLNILLADGSENVVAAPGAELEGVEGIYVSGDLTISGKGTLDVTGGSAVQGSSHGIRVDGSLIIREAVVNSCGGGALADSIGVYIDGGSLTVESGSLYAQGADESGVLSTGIGITKGSMEVNGGTVNAVGGSALVSVGIAVAGELAAGSDPNGAVLTGGKLTVNGGAITAVGGEALVASFGISATPHMAVYGGTVEAAGGNMSEGDEFSMYSVGILVDVLSPGEESAEILYNEPGALAIDGGSVSAVGGDVTGSCASAGMLVRGTMNLSDEEAVSCAAGSVEEGERYDLHVCLSAPFDDILPNTWEHPPVDFVVENNLMDSYTDSTFAPDSDADRATLAVALWRLEGEPVVNYAMTFEDVDQDADYAEAVRWATAEGIVTGHDDTTFAPGDPITREQLAAMLYRYAQLKGMGFTGAWAFRLDFEDVADIHEYAYESLCWVTMKGIMIGQDGKLLPRETATRAEMAAMLMRFCDVLSGEADG